MPNPSPPPNAHSTNAHPTSLHPASVIRHPFAALDELLDKTILLSYTNVGYHLRRLRWDDTAVPLPDHTCLVTGANAGLGRIIATQLARRGATVHMLCRSAERGAAAQQAIRQAAGHDRVHLHVVDLSSQQAIRDFAAAFGRERPLDLLVNNASVLLPARQLSADGIELTFATNVLGYFLLTELLRPNLLAAAAARVVNVTSGGLYTARLHPDDLQYAIRPFNGTTAYAESKRAELVLTEQWAAAWRGTGIAVHAVHPGWADTPGVQTSLPRFARLMRPLLRTPRQGADGIVWLCTTPDLARFPNGRLWFDRQPRPHHKLGMPRNTPAEIQQFWQICHDLTACSIS